ncbi:ribbon-helix-helix protein, CopG family [Calothrix sp. PCC 6303]|nr:ribbon-helix-helix protein, CopG family [Calothrix sp. PCC 6303]
MPIQLDEIERQKLEALASKWGLSLSGVVRRLIREYSDV